tara:strand:- start:444 stop:566 length:123 start_codon:yes stop_codon:yes gene_type:complete
MGRIDIRNLQQFDDEPTEQKFKKKKKKQDKEEGTKLKGNK